MLGGVVPGSVVLPGSVGLPAGGVVSGVVVSGVVSGAGVVGLVSGVVVPGLVSGVGFVGAVSGAVSGVVPGAGVAVPGVGFAVPGVGFAVPGAVVPGVCVEPGVVVPCAVPVVVPCVVPVVPCPAVDPVWPVLAPGPAPAVPAPPAVCHAADAYITPLLRSTSCWPRIARRCRAVVRDFRRIGHVKLLRGSLQMLSHLNRNSFQLAAAEWNRSQRPCSAPGLVKRRCPRLRPARH